MAGIRLKKTITKYMFMELIGPFFLGLLVFTFVLLMEKVLDLIELVINKGVSLPVVLKLVMYIMPSFLVLTIPMAVLVATLTAFGRLSTDSEITAMKASGISLYSLFGPVCAFALIASVLTFFLYSKALPWGNHNFRVTLYELARTKASVGLKAHIFNNTFPGLAIYIDEISDGHNTFNGVMISDSRDVHQQQTIFARKGRLISDEKALRVILRLYDGAIHPRFLGDPLKYQIVDFPTLDILLSLQRGDPDALMTIPQTDREMTIAELYEKYITLARKDQLARDEEAGRDTEADDYKTPKLKGLAKIRYALARFGLDGFSFPGPLSSPYLVELHKRFSIPFACLVFGLIGTPLGIQSRRAGRSGGYAISVVLLLIYYLFITAGESLGDDGRLPVLWAVWTPNLLLGIVGLFLLIRVARR